MLGVGVGAAGTLVGAGGGFLLAPVLLLAHPHDSPQTLTAASSRTSAGVVRGRPRPAALARARGRRDGRRAGRHALVVARVRAADRAPARARPGARLGAARARRLGRRLPTFHSKRAWHRRRTTPAALRPAAAKRPISAAST